MSFIHHKPYLVSVINTNNKSSSKLWDQLVIRRKWPTTGFRDGTQPTHHKAKSTTVHNPVPKSVPSLPVHSKPFQIPMCDKSPMEILSSSLRKPLSNWRFMPTADFLRRLKFKPWNLGYGLNIWKTLNGQNLDSKGHLSYASFDIIITWPVDSWA